MITLILAFFGRIKGWLIAAGGVLLAVGAAYFTGRMTGSSDERADQAEKLNEQAAKARQEAQDVHNQVARQSDDAVSAELKSGWVRK